MKTVEEILYKVWKEQLSVTNGSAEIVSIIEAERARNTALVEALEKIKQEHGYRYTYGDGFGNVVEKRINSVGVAVDNALTANTEKGGANE